MRDLPGIRKAELQELPIVADRITFLYLEHCVVNRESGAITATDKRGTVFIPAAALAAVLLGPGTKLTHRAMELMADSGVSTLWVGEHGVKCYAHGQAMTHSAAMLIRQAQLVSNNRSRLAVARKMYSMRFGGEDTSGLTMQQLRGKEGARMRAVYRKASKQWNVPWSGREYDPEDFSASDPVNAALSVGNACLYGLAHCAILAMGCSSGLGFVHCGHDRSFVYDLADLYKAEITIPLAFEIASREPADIAAEMRHAVRDAFVSKKVLERMVHDIRALFLEENILSSAPADVNVVYLWDEKLQQVVNGVSYGKESEMRGDADWSL